MPKVSISTVFGNILKEINVDLKEADSKARDVVIERMIKDTDEFVPYLTGETSRSVSKLPANGGFQYNTPYASYAFEPVAPSGVRKKYTTDVHPKAQGYPFEAAQEEHLDEWLDLYAKEVLKNL